MSYAERAAHADCGAAYETLRQDLIALVRGLDPAERARTVPATPAWTVRDVLGHVTGLTEDLNHGNFDGSDADAWTRHQVERHRDEPLDATIAAWDAEAPTFERGLRELGYEIGSHFVGDLLIHLVDVRAALDLPIDVDAPPVWIALDFYLIARLVIGEAAAPLVAAVLVAVFVLLWAVLPRWRRLQRLVAS